MSGNSVADAVVLIKIRSVTGGIALRNLFFLLLLQHFGASSCGNIPIFCHWCRQNTDIHFGMVYAALTDSLVSRSIKMTNTALSNAVVVSQKKKWGQLALGLLCMISISSPQYVWALFTRPLMEKLNAPLAEIQITFSILIILQTFFSPI
ncbi:hypothetical protein JOJ88_005500 [Pantoea cypripedii]|nr:hypothetical protein [Pantoea cypripedii]